MAGFSTGFLVDRQLRTFLRWRDDMVGGGADSHGQGFHADRAEPLLRHVFVIPDDPQHGAARYVGAAQPGQGLGHGAVRGGDPGAVECAQQQGRGRRIRGADDGAPSRSETGHRRGERGCFARIGGASPRPARGLYADTSQVEGVDGVKMLVDAGIGGKVLFGSHAPVFMPAAAIARVIIDLHEDTAVGIMEDNAAELLGFDRAY